MKKDTIKKSSFLRGEELVQGLTTPQGSPIGFTPINTAAEWINTDRIYSLWNIAYNLGKFYAESFTNKPLIGFKLSKTNPIALELFPQGFTVAVGKGTGLIEGGIEFIELKNGLKIIWHKELTCMAVDSFITETYKMAKEFGEMENGKLKFTEAFCKYTTPLLSVEEIFSTCFAAGPFPNEVKDEEILQSFDKPEMLTIINGPFGKLVVLSTRKTDTEKEIVTHLEKLKALGIDINNIGDLDEEEIIRIRELMG